MSDLNDIRVGDIKHLDSTPPEGAKPASVMTMEVAVENKPQALKMLRPYAAIMSDIPKSIQPEAQIVLHAIFACFDRQKSVQEGKVDDLVWGFEQAGIPAGATAMGLSLLEQHGYLKFQYEDNTPSTVDHTRWPESWVRYQPKLLELAYEKPAGT